MLAHRLIPFTESAKILNLFGMFRDALTKLDQLEAQALLTTLNPLLQGSPFEAESVTILSAELSFYPDHVFYEIADHAVMPARKIFTIVGAGLGSGAKAGPVATILDWTNTPIYQLNRDVPIYLNERNAVEYIRFFFSFVRGRHGRFLITETIDDIAWKDEPPATARKAIGGLIEPLRLIGVDDKGCFVFNARMMFKDSLFKGRVSVTPGGIVTLSDEELVVEDMPVLDDTLGQ